MPCTDTCHSEILMVKTQHPWLRLTLELVMFSLTGLRTLLNPSTAQSILSYQCLTCTLLERVLFTGGTLQSCPANDRDCLAAGMRVHSCCTSVHADCKHPYSSTLAAHLLYPRCWSRSAACSTSNPVPNATIFDMERG